MSTQDTAAAPIVVGAHDSPTGRRAIHRAAEIARLIGAPLHFVSAVKSDRGHVMEGPGTDTWVLNDADATRRFVEELAVTVGDLETSIAVVEGKPGEVMGREAERIGAGLIVVGNHRVQGAGRVLGAVANNVARHAPCDVYIAYTKD